MYGKTHTFRKSLGVAALAAALAAVVAPMAAAGGSNGPGLVPSKLGSQDPRETDAVVQSAPGIVPAKLGSQDPRDTAAQSELASSIIASRLGSQDPRDTATARSDELNGDYMFRDYFRNTHYVVQESPWERALRIRGEALNQQYFGAESKMTPAQLRALNLRSQALNETYGPDRSTPVSSVDSTDEGFDWQSLGIVLGSVIGIVALLIAVGVGLRQRHTAHQLGNA